MTKPKPKQTPKISRIKQSLKNFSPFAALCVVGALAYIGYRVFSFVGPNGLGALVGRDTDKPVEIGCSQDVDLETPGDPDKLPLVSASYQEYIQRQPAKGDNLIDNFSLENLDSNTRQPRNYYHIADADYLKYEYLRDSTTNAPFLRVESSRKVSSTELAGGWMSRPATIEANATYAYSFAYRSTASLTISVEYTMPDGTLNYSAITKLNRSDNWSRFTHYIDNQRGAKAFRFIVVSREAGTVDTRDYSAYKIADATLQEPRISITFDDGWQSIADHGLAVLDKYDLKTTQYIISEASDQHVGEYMDVDTLKGMRKDGHEIGSHTLSHCDQTKLSNMDILKNARDSKNNLERDGLGPIDSFAYPYGRYNETTQPLVAGAYTFMRTSDAGYNDRYFDSRNIKSMVILDRTTDQEFQGWLDYAKANKLWLVIAYHRVNEHGDYSVTSAQLDRQLRMIKQSGIKSEPLAQTAKTIHR